jgi:hypothetical protein
VNQRRSSLFSLTDDGRTTIERHWQRLESLRQGLREWQPPDEQGVTT